MRVVRSSKAMSSISGSIKKTSKTIGLVPTMGFLHDGHLSLIKKAAYINDKVVVSIFVNPIQFGPNEDYERYPRDPSRDIKLAGHAGADYIFYPSLKDIYPPGYSTYVNVEGISQPLCGRSRPGHFKGVATICAKLFNIVRPDAAYFGQKDFQQALIIKRMAADLNMGIKIYVAPIKRQRDGLAMSSRNKYLTNSQRRDAPALYSALRQALKLISAGEKNAGRIIACIKRIILAKPGMRIDYVAVVDPSTLKDIKHIRPGALIAVAVWLGKTRLLDNVIVRRI